MRSLITIFALPCAICLATRLCISGAIAETPRDSPQGIPVPRESSSIIDLQEDITLSGLKPLSLKPAEIEGSFPLVLRIDKSALETVLKSDIDERLPIDRIILGTHAVGESRTRGSIYPVLIPNSTEASFDIRFQGSTATKTIGTQKPAIIHSRTSTDFVCTCRIAFDPRKGFVPIGNARISGDTRLVHDGFSSTRLLGRRVIARIAERRAGQMHEQARLIAQRDQQQEVRTAFEKAISQQLTLANEKSNLVRYVNQFLGEKASLQLYAKSSAECIHIGIGPDSEKYAPMTVLPPGREKPTPIEIWVDASILNEPMAALFKLTTPATRLPLSAQKQFLEVLSLPRTDSESSSLDVAIRDGWLVLSFVR